MRFVEINMTLGASAMEMPTNAALAVKMSLERRYTGATNAFGVREAWPMSVCRVISKAGNSE